MTSSGSPHGDEAGLDQEAIRDEPSAPEAGSRQQPTAPSGPPADAASLGLTRRITSTTRTPGPAGLFYADVPNRIMALIIDIIVLSVIGFALAWLFGGLITKPGAIDSTGGELDIVAFAVVLVLQLTLSFVYFGGSWTQLGATVGMRLLGLSIGDEVDGSRIGWRHAAVRWTFLGIPSVLASLAVYVPDAIGFILAVFGIAWLVLVLYTIAQSPTKQGLHDRYAHTILVKTRRRVA